MKNKIIEKVNVEKVGYGGIGISTLSSGIKLLINGGVVPGSIVDCKVIKSKKDYLECQVINIHSFGTKKNLENLCKHYLFNEKGGCGGCKWQILPYEKQLEIKYQIIADSFRNIKDYIDNIGIQEIISSPKIFGYRNKIEFTFGNNYYDNQDWNLGFNKQGDFSTVIDIVNCKLVDEKINELFIYLKNIFIQSGLPIYNKEKHTGIFRHLVIRYGEHTGQILINLVISNNNLSDIENGKQDFDKLLNILTQDKFLQENIISFVVTNNNGLADIVKSNDVETKIIWGKGHIYENLIFDDKLDINQKITVNFRISPFSFFQTNTLGAEILFSKAIGLIGEVNGTILDLYCGTGSIGLSFLKLGACKNLVGIEILEDAVIDAKFNASINGLQKESYFISGKAENLKLESVTIPTNIIENIKVIIVDPPRDGLHKDVIKFLINIKNDKNIKLLYISCNPVTMSRDIEILIHNGFKLDILQPVDMFPHTHHIEIIGVLC